MDFFNKNGNYANTNKKSAIALIQLMLLIFSLVLIVHGSMIAQHAPVQDLENSFSSPPDSVKPSVYWYWISDNVSAEGIDRDLEAMAEAGIGRAFIGNIGLGPEQTPTGEVPLLSERWLELTQRAIRKASQVGVDIGLFNSPGWSQSGGPWVTPEQSMRYLAHTQTLLQGPQKVTRQLDRPEGYFEDVRVLAFPAPPADGQTIARAQPSVMTRPVIPGASHWVDGDTTSTALLPEQATKSGEVIIDITTPKAFCARSLMLYPAHRPFKADISLQVKRGDVYRTIKEFTFDRSNGDQKVGFKPFGPMAIVFPEVRSRTYRLVLRNMEGAGGLEEIALSPAARVEHYIEKQLAKMHQTPLPLWGTYQWDQQPDVEEKALKVDPGEVIDITDKVSADGVLQWQAPEGQWVVLRLGMRSTGVTNHPASPEGRGLEVDKLNRQPLKAHFNAFIGRVLQSMPEDQRTALKYVVADSYETGSQNWTDGFAKDFKQVFGYDPLPWLPVLTGRVVDSADQSSRFLWDLRRIVADRVAYEYVGGLRELAHQHNMKVWLENYGHWGFPAEFLQYGGQADEVAGEFWAEGDLGSIELRAASSAAHIYGKNKVAAESFTANLLTRSQPFDLHPGKIKKRGDWAFTEGVNHTLLHVYIMQPYEDRNPGMNAWFGTEFNRKNTWFDHMNLFTDYLRRSMFMLQQGQPVADVAYFIGEGAPKMTGIQQPKLPSGYSFDYINAEVIRERLSVKNGKLVLPDGISYEVLVLPDLETMRPELLKKIKSLVEAGANILGPKPKRSPSLENFPEADRQARRMADELWGEVDGTSVKIGTYGNGTVMWGIDIQQALDKVNVQPDFEASRDSPVLYTHRTMGDTEIYFVTNQSGEKISIFPTFRVEGKQPEFWDPVPGTSRPLSQFEQTPDGRTRVPLTLEAAQSGFVVFNKSLTDQEKTEAQNFPSPETIAEVEGPWKVSFDAARRGPAGPVEFDRLIDWSEHPDERIRYYSGSAVYRTHFTVPQGSGEGKLYLDLGSVKVMGQVWVNGQDVGGVWTPPYRVDVSNAIREGENRLEIEVVNTWVNRLIGDSKLPASQRPSWAPTNSYTPAHPLQPAGLLGPVTLKKINY